MNIDRELMRRLPPHLRIEENIQRKDFTQSELGAIQQALTGVVMSRARRLKPIASSMRRILAATLA
jgi:hypothetical protein